MYAKTPFMNPSEYLGIHAQTFGSLTTVQYTYGSYDPMHGNARNDIWGRTKCANLKQDLTMRAKWV